MVVVPGQFGLLVAEGNGRHPIGESTDVAIVNESQPGSWFSSDLGEISAHPEVIPDRDFIVERGFVKPRNFEFKTGINAAILSNPDHPRIIGEILAPCSSPPGDLTGAISNRFHECGDLASSGSNEIIRGAPNGNIETLD